MLLLAMSCGSHPLISETRMAYAPSREAGCAVQLVNADPTAISFNQQWEVLGWVLLQKNQQQDPGAEENRRLVRPRACAMAGTAVAVGISATQTNALGQTGSGISYMVLRPKSFTAPPERF
jgi:hypothetical protein